MKQEVKRLEKLVAEKRAQADQTHSDDEGSVKAGSEHETVSEEDDVIDDLPAAQVEKAKKKGPRASVSAEAFGAWNKKADFVARVIVKAPETVEKISKRLKQSFLF